MALAITKQNLHCCKKNVQTYVEFVGDLSTHFKQWLAALGVTKVTSERLEFSPSDLVLAFMSIVGLPFQAKYTSPYTVAHKVSDLNYVVATPGC